jgi:hypothetical protein
MSERQPRKTNEVQLDQIVKDTESLLGNIFDRMELAEEEIAQAMREDPRNAELYNSSFKLLVPTETLISDLLYQRHCQEMLYRVVEELDTRPGTDAEVLGALSEASHHAPMNTSGLLAYARMFRNCFPDLTEEADALDKAAGHERYPGSVDELIETCRKKLTVKERVLDGEAN